MLIPFLIILAFFSYSNAQRAQIRGRNPLLWSFITFLFFCLGLFLACMILGIILMVKNPSLYQLSLQGDQKAVNNFLAEAFKHNNFLYSTLIILGGFGGYLFTRYLIERKTPRA